MCQTIELREILGDNVSIVYKLCVERIFGVFFNFKMTKFMFGQKVEDRGYHIIILLEEGFLFYIISLRLKLIYFNCTHFYIYIQLYLYSGSDIY